MELVTHLWKFSEALTKIKSLEANEIRNHYIQCCRELGKDVDLPDKFFGTKNMCPYCGSLWNSIDHSVRISKARNSSALINKLTRSIPNRDLNLSTVKKKLIEKLEKNQMNKLIITCSCCQNKTKITLPKVKKEKKLKKANLRIENNGVSSKKKKRKSRDRTAGLFLTPKTSNAKSMDNSTKKYSIASVVSQTSEKLKKSTSIPPAEAKKKINFLKVKGMINSSSTPLSKKTGLDSLLTEN